VSLRTPLAKVKGLGSAREGARHWWHQRLTAIALIPLSFWFVYSLAIMAGTEHAMIVQWLRQPHVALLFILFVAALFYHAQLGMQVIVEDYVHSEWQKITSIILIRFLALVGALSAILSILNVFLGFSTP